MNQGEYEQGKGIGYFHGLTRSLIEVSESSSVPEAMERLSALMAGVA